MNKQNINEKLIDEIRVCNLQEEWRWIEAGADVNARDNYGMTLLHWVASSGSTDSATVLLDYGADVNARDNYGMTPLHWVALRGDTDTAAVLLDRGAHLNAQNNYGSTPLHWNCNCINMLQCYYPYNDT